VTVVELLKMVNIALDLADVTICTAGDPSGDGQVTINEILMAVNNALEGCALPVSHTQAAPNSDGVRVALTDASVAIQVDTHGNGTTDRALPRCLAPVRAVTHQHRN
jgi:hypothetical protein